MTLYNGEKTTICHSAKDGDDVVLTSADVSGVHITIYNRDLTTVVLTERAMTWRAAKSRWEYDWVTAGVQAGTYRVKVRIQGLDGHSVWEYGRIKLAQDLVPA